MTTSHSKGYEAKVIYFEHPKGEAMNKTNPKTNPKPGQVWMPAGEPTRLRLVSSVDNARGVYFYEMFSNFVQEESFSSWDDWVSRRAASVAERKPKVERIFSLGEYSLWVVDGVCNGKMPTSTPRGIIKALARALAKERGVEIKDCGNLHDAEPPK